MLPGVDFFEKLPVIIKWNDWIKSQVVIVMKKGSKQGGGVECSICVLYPCLFFMF